jgi:large subunit ribosomal protein L25
MAKQVQLKVTTRTEQGRNPLKRLRTRDVIPGIVYGAINQPLRIAIATKELEKALHGAGENVLVDLQVEEGGKVNNRLALIQEVQHHPYKDIILHVDFHEVSATEKLRTSVPVRAVGEPAGVKTGGGVLEFVMRELRVECLPKDLPDVIEVNVEALEIGQSIHLAGIQPPAGVAWLDNKDQVVFIVAAPVAEEEVVAEPGAAAAEPEVIGAKKEEGEEGAAAEGAEKGKPAAKAEAGKAAPAGKADAKPATAGKPAAGKPAEAKAAPAGKPAAKK